MSNISTWSTTAASNNAASPNGFPEGMLPSGVNNAAREVMAAVRAWFESAEWINLGHTPTYVSTVSFTIPTDVTTAYHAGRRMKFTDASTLYGTISTSVYSSPNTTITVVLDSGELSASLTEVAFGSASKTNSSIPASIALQIPAGSVISWLPGYFADGSNGTYTFALGSANTVAAANTYLNPLGWYVCDGAALNLAASPIFVGASRYLPNLTDSRFLMGSTAAGSIGGSNTMAHTHDVVDHTHTGPSHTHTGPSHTHDTTVPIDGWGYSAAISGYMGSSAPNETARATSNRTFTSAASGTGATGSSGTGATGSGGAQTSSAASNTENRPLYLSCFYIMRVL